eukprot:TRINITY_DN38918_c0_g1_i2.p1 TRINITY_DN38918_c0_g1~~TRINITY_DN38918_c0_g1_i2.p1  ORF type:complete len:279 (-),score=44.28 TRINITY_DN38918_c0_g1_i2:62-898(-)
MRWQIQVWELIMSQVYAHWENLQQLIDTETPAVLLVIRSPNRHQYEAQQPPGSRLRLVCNPTPVRRLLGDVSRLSCNVHKPWDASNIATWPTPTDTVVETAPFLLGAKESLPSECAQYWPLINLCPVDPEDLGKVAYLSVIERFVPQGQTIDGGVALGVQTLPVDSDCTGEFTIESQPLFRRVYGKEHVIRIRCGMYQGSTASGVCRVWNAEIGERLGDEVECLRQALGEGTALNAGEVVWMTGRAPYEMLPLSQGQYVQFFRSVSYTHLTLPTKRIV